MKTTQEQLLDRFRFCYRNLIIATVVTVVCVAAIIHFNLRFVNPHGIFVWHENGPDPYFGHYEATLGGYGWLIVLGNLCIIIIVFVLNRNHRKDLRKYDLHNDVALYDDEIREYRKAIIQAQNEKNLLDKAGVDTSKEEKRIECIKEKLAEHEEQRDALERHLEEIKNSHVNDFLDYAFQSRLGKVLVAPAKWLSATKY